VKVWINEARCPACGPRRYYVFDETGERVDLPGVGEMEPGQPTNAKCACGEQILFDLEPLRAESQEPPRA
jgi:hypothetical protein